MTDRLALPAAAALAFLTLALWLYLLLFQAAGVQVANRSGAVIGGLSVCLTSGECLHRDRLWPHQTWQVPLDRAAGERVKLTVQDAGSRRPLVSHAPRVEGEPTSFVVGRGGRIELQ